MDTTKKIYSAPKLTRVRLVVKTSVLGNCHASPVMTAQTSGMGCKTVEIAGTPCYVGVMD